MPPISSVETSEYRLKSITSTDSSGRACAYAQASWNSMVDLPDPPLLLAKVNTSPTGPAPGPAPAPSAPAAPPARNMLNIAVAVRGRVVVVVVGG